MDEKSAKLPQKARKKRAKNVKKPPKKSKFALAHLAKSTPSAEKSPRTPPSGPVARKKSPKNRSENRRENFIHNRQRSKASVAPNVTVRPFGRARGRQAVGSEGENPARSAGGLGLDLDVPGG